MSFWFIALGLLAFPAVAAPPPIDAYGKLPAIENPHLSPDGNRLAYLSSVRGRRCLIIHHLDTRKKDSTSCPGAYEVRWFAWKTEQRLILEVYAQASPQDSVQRTETRLIALNADGTRLKKLTEAGDERAADFGENRVIDLLQDDPDHILVSVYGSDPDSPDVIEFDVNTGATRTVVPGQNRITNWKTDPKGQVRLGVAIKDSAIHTYYRDDGLSDFRLLRKVDVARSSSFSVLAIGSAPGILYIASSEPTGRRAIYTYDARQDRVVSTYASRPDADIESLMLDHGHPLGYGYTVDEPELVFTDPILKADTEQIAQVLPSVRPQIVDSTASGRRLLVLATGGARPGAYYLLDRDAQKATLNFLGNVRPGVRDTALAGVTPIDYRARDGLKIHGYLTMPQNAGSGPIPFVVLPHGGPSARDMLGFDYIAQMIASRGYGVLQMNFRGSRGYGAAFERAGFQEWGLAMQDDVTDGTQWLIEQKLADPSRICIVGWSYGGYTALMGAVKTPDLFRCAASMAGVTDLRRRLDRASNSRFADLNVPKFDSDPAIIAANSPVLHADKIKIPVLLAHGRRDFTVSVLDSENMETALRRAGKPVEAIYFNNVDHYLYREADRITYLKALERFLKENLGPGVTELAGAATN